MIDSGTIIWMGPVSQSNLNSVKIPDNWDIVTISQEVVAPNRPGPVALTPTDFRNFASTLGADPLTVLMKRSKKSPKICLIASFSAGHGLLEPLLRANAGDPRIHGVYSADSYYGLEIKEGYYNHAKACINSGSRFWLSTSNTKGGTTIHSGSESVLPFANQLQLDADSPSIWMPPPVTSRGWKNVQWLDYQALFTHIQHATVLCPTALRIWMGELIGGVVPPSDLIPSGPPADPSQGLEAASISPSSKVGMLIVGAVLGFYGVKKISAQ